MNFMWLMGHLGADAETRYTAGGKKVTTLRLAVNQRRSGQEETTWYRVTIWGDRYDQMVPYLKKGSALVVGGELRKPELYTDRNGQQQVSLEVWAELIHFSPFGKSNRSEQQQGGAQPYGQPFAAPSYSPEGEAGAAQESYGAPYNFGGNGARNEDDPFASYERYPQEGQKDDLPF